MIRVLIVDDEALARSRLATLVAECTEPRCAVAGQCASAQQARQWLSEYAADIVLLDIQMPGQIFAEPLARLLRAGALAGDGAARLGAFRQIGRAHV